MKNLILLFTAIIFGASSAMAVTVEDKVAVRNAYNYNNSFIFVEDGITFSVYPDGEFDFYLENGAGVNANVNFRNVNITYNSGYDYNPYVQYDDYGAVIQVENIPIYYDYYGRVTQVGNVDISYNRGRVNRLGGLYVYYNGNGLYSHHTGFINVYNRNYIYRPFHNYFARPAVGLCLVYNRPYRRYYEPVRYTYYRPYYNNYRKSYAKFGHEHKYKKDHYRKSDVYRNDRRVVARDNNSRRDNGYRTSGNVIKRSESRSVDYARNGKSSRNDRSNYDSKRNVENSRNNTSNRAVRSNNDSKRTIDNSRTYNSNGTDRSNTYSKRTADRNVSESRSSRPAENRTVTKKEVSRTPRSTTVARTSTSYKKPEGRSSSRTVSTRTQKSVSSKPNSSRNSRSTQVSSRSSSPSNVSKSTTSNRRSSASSAKVRSSRDF